jgi:hypothetical protein
VLNSIATGKRQALSEKESTTFEADARASTSIMALFSNVSFSFGSILNLPSIAALSAANPHPASRPNFSGDGSTPAET